MSGRVCAGVLHRASSCTLTLSSPIAPLTQPAHQCNSSWASCRSDKWRLTGDPGTGPPGRWRLAEAPGRGPPGRWRLTGDPGTGPPGRWGLAEAPGRGPPGRWGLAGDPGRGPPGRWGLAEAPGRGPPGRWRLAEAPGRGPPGRRHLSTRHHRDFHLSRVQVDSILRSNEQEMVNLPEFDGRGLSAVRRFESNHLAANTPNEDRRSAATCLQSTGMLFGVFDGHGGWPCAQAVGERLLDYTAVAMMSKQRLRELETCMEDGRAVPPILQWYKHHADFDYRESASLYIDHLRVFWQELLDSEEHVEGMSPMDALDCSFKRLDADISLEAQVPLSNDLVRSTAIQVAFAGSTACVAHVCTHSIHVANAGDCRAVLGVLEEDGSWSALPLSQDHNTQNPAEVERIKNQHPTSERDTVITDDRLLGVLMPLRAFGDVRFKWSLELQQSILANLESGVDLDSLDLYQYTPPNYLTPPYLDVVPEITRHKLRPQDRFLILGTDGLWDELGNEEAVRLVGEHLSGSHLQAPVSPSERQMKLGWIHKLLLKRRARVSPASDANAATHLIRHALGSGEHGQLSQERLATMLALPRDLARMYRDDITATVVYLNSDLATP